MACSYVLTGGNVIFVVHPMFKQFASILLFPMHGANGSVYGVSMMPVMWLGVLILGWFILRRTFLGRAIFAMGGNEVAAERIGVNTLWTRVFVFSFVGLLSGVRCDRTRDYRAVGNPEHHRWPRA